MDWFFIALICPFLWVISNFIDKYLVTKHFKGKVGALMIFSSVVAVLFIPVIYFFQPSVLNLSLSTAIIVLLNSFLLLIYLFPYFWALEKDDASNVVPIFQTIPIFGIILGFLILHESISLQQLLAIIVVISGSFIISVRFNKKGFLFKKEVLVLMLTAAFLIALNTAVFKFFALEFDFWTIMFWNYSGSVLFGILLLIFKKKYRREFFAVFKKTNGKVILINVVNELINFSAWMIFSFATLMAPLGLIWIANSFQPIFILIVGYGLTIFFPKINTEEIGNASLVRKVIAIAIMLIGIAILYI